MFQGDFVDIFIHTLNVYETLLVYVLRTMCAHSVVQMISSYKNIQSKTTNF